MPPNPTAAGTLPTCATVVGPYRRATWRLGHFYFFKFFHFKALLAFKKQQCKHNHKIIS
jgi:hypothetical protein